MPDPFRLPRIKTLDRLVDALGRPTVQFVKFFNVDFAGAIERQEAAQATASAALAAVVADLAAAVADIQAAQATADAAVTAAAAAQTEIDDVIAPQVVAVTQVVQIAQTSANSTQTEVDVLAAGGTQSGSASNPSVDVPDGTWVQGPQVDLTGVVAGNLTITGSGPVQDSDVNTVSGNPFYGEFRIVEIDGFTETVLVTIAFTVADRSVSTGFSGSVAAFSSARTNTGAISYRIDARRASGTESLLSLSLYIYARRVA